MLGQCGAFYVLIFLYLTVSGLNFLPGPAEPGSLPGKAGQGPGQKRFTVLPFGRAAADLGRQGTPGVQGPGCLLYTSRCV